MAHELQIAAVALARNFPAEKLEIGGGEKDRAPFVGGDHLLHLAEIADFQAGVHQKAAVDELHGEFLLHAADAVQAVGGIHLQVVAELLLDGHQVAEFFQVDLLRRLQALRFLEDADAPEFGQQENAGEPDQQEPEERGLAESRHHRGQLAQQVDEIQEQQQEQQIQAERAPFGRGKGDPGGPDPGERPQAQGEEKKVHPE